MKTVHKRGQFTFYASYFDAVHRLPKSRRLEAYDALALYALDGVEPELCSTGVNSMFEGIRPNIDSGRTKAEKMQNAKCKTQNDAEAGEMQNAECKMQNDAEAERKNKTKKKNKNKSKSEKERKTETEIKIENEAETEGAAAEGRAESAAEGLSPAPAVRGPEAGDPELSLSEREHDEIISGCADAVCGQETGVSELSLPEREHDEIISGCAEPSPEEAEEEAAYAEMFRADPCLASAWRSLLAAGPGDRPLAPGERERLLKRLRAAPDWDRLGIVCDRLGSSYARDWARLRPRPSS